MQLYQIVLLAVFVLVLAFIVGTLAYIDHTFTKTFRRQKNYAPWFFTYEDLAARFPSYKREELDFTVKKTRLHGYLYGDKNAKKMIVFCHGIRNDADGYSLEEKYFADRGFYVFAFDSVGSGRSEGNSEIGLPVSAAILDGVLAYIEREERFSPYEILLYGHSWGGFAVNAVFAYATHPRVKKSVSVSAYDSSAMVSVDTIRPFTGKGALFFYPFLTVYMLMKFGKNGLIRATDGINRSQGVKFLIIHGEKDKTVYLDGSSVWKAKKRIKDKEKVRFLVRKERGHNNVVLSEAAAQAQADFEKRIVQSIFSKTPSPVLREEDRESFSALDEKLFEEMVNFYNE